jgi:hypothetical protein
MCRVPSDEQIRAIDNESRQQQPRRHLMYTTESVKAEVSYRKERLTRDYRRANRSTRGRRHLAHLFTRNA